MVALNLSLPVDLQRYVDRRASAEGYDNPADFVRDVVQRDRGAYEADLQRVRALVREGAASGVLDEEPEDILDQIIADLNRPHG